MLISFGFTSYYLFSFAHSESTEKARQVLRAFIYLQNTITAESSFITPQKKAELLHNIQKNNKNLSISATPLFTPVSLNLSDQSIANDLIKAAQFDQRNFSIYLPKLDKWINIEHHNLLWLNMLFLVILQIIFMSFLIYYSYSSIKLLAPWVKAKALSRKIIINNAPNQNPSLSGPKLIAQSADLMDKIIYKIEHFESERALMLNALTHDIRTPLARLMLLCEKIQDETLAEKIESDIIAINDHLTKMLNFTQKTFSQEAVTEISLYHALEKLSQEYDSDKVQFNAENSMAKYLVKAQENQLLSAFKNLIDNALKYAGNCDIHLQLKSPQQIEVIFSDNGPGVNETSLNTLSRPFYREDSARNTKTQGSGLGLSISQLIFINHNATMKIENKLHGTGLVISVCFQVG